PAWWPPPRGPPAPRRGWRAPWPGRRRRDRAGGEAGCGRWAGSRRSPQAPHLCRYNHEIVPLRYRPSGRTADEISRSVEEAIAQGRLGPGSPLPPIRTLAADLGVSPTTVAAAYRWLGRRGVVVTGGRRGTRVAARPPLPARPRAAVPPGVRDLASGNPDPALLPDLGPALARLHGRAALYGDAPNVDA